tara:strand:+ start:58 stop:696 length:639 start_codon:yes stop_codon:yes gene_type:complete
MHQLYSFRRCPYAIRTRMTLCYSAIKVELREVALKNKPELMMQLSTKGTVPVLQLDSQEVLTESREIIAWALQQADTNDWLYRDHPNQQQEILSLVDDNDYEFKAWLDRYKYSDRNPIYSRVCSREQGLTFLAKLNYKLGKNPFLFGETICWADIAIFPFVRQFAFVDKYWFDKQNLDFLQAWLNSHLHSDLFLSVMGKYSAWKVGDKPIIF